jgi:iron complex outermembrane receptor protein
LQELSASKNEGFWTNHTELKANMSRLDTLNVANTTRYDLTENVYIKNIFGYRHLNTSVPFDFDGSSQLLQSGLTTLNASQYSDELQLSGSAFDNSLDFIAGLYAFKESGREVQLTTLDYRPAFLRQLNGIGDVKNKSRSVFAQGTWHVPNVEGLSVTAGGRYTWDDRSVTRIAFNGATCQLLSADVGGVPLNPCTRTATYEHKEPTYTAGVDWQVTPNKLIYFTTRKGYRSGGLNQRANLPGQLRPFQPEIVIDYEVGVKADWNLGGAGRLRTNIAAYHQGYSNIQRTQVTNSGVAVLTTVVNAARARVNGLEADVTWTPTHDLSIRAYYALADSKYLEWRVPLAAGGFQDRSDYDFASTPRSSGGATITYTHALPGDDGEISLQGDIYTQSKTQLADDNLTPEGVNAGYTVANARVEWRHPMASDLTLAAWVRNLAAEKYYTGGSQQITAGLGTVVKNLGAPRTFGISARYDF